MIENDEIKTVPGRQTDDTVLEIGGVPFLWRWFEGEFKVHCPTYQIYEQMKRWKGVRDGGKYYLPGRTMEYDIILPEELQERATKLLEQWASETPVRPANRSNGSNGLGEPRLPLRAGESVW